MSISHGPGATRSVSSSRITDLGMFHLDINLLGANLEIYYNLSKFNRVALNHNKRHAK